MCAETDHLLRVCHISIARRYSYVIVFRYTDDAMEIITVTNGRMDWTNRQPEIPPEPVRHAHSGLYDSIWGDNPSSVATPAEEPTQTPRPPGLQPELD